MSSPSGKVLAEASPLAPAAYRCPPLPMLIFWHAVKIVQGELASLDLHKQIAHWGTIQLMQIAFTLDYFTWSFKISYKTLMELCILYFEGRGAACLCVFFGGRSRMWRSKFKIAKTFQIFCNSLPAKCWYCEVKLKWSMNFIFTEENLSCPSGDTECSLNSTTDSRSATALGFFPWGFLSMD